MSTHSSRFATRQTAIRLIAVAIALVINGGIAGTFLWAGQAEPRVGAAAPGVECAAGLPQRSPA